MPTIFLVFYIACAIGYLICIIISLKRGELGLALFMTVMLVLVLIMAWLLHQPYRSPAQDMIDALGAAYKG